MATYTENYSLVKPGYGDQADIDVLNRLMTDKVDALLFENRRISADEYDQEETYAVGDYAIYENVLYKCLEDTTGNFDPSKWEMTNLAKEVSTKGGADVTKTASGNPITFDDGASAPLVRCVTEIQGTQDLHGYSKPWVGGAGKNKLNYPNEIVHPTAQTTTNLVSDLSLNAGTYTFSLNQVTTLSSATRNTLTVTYDGNTYYESASGNYHLQSGVHSITFTLDSNTTVRLSLWTTELSESTTYNNAQLETGSSATAFEPYANICPITAYTQGEIEVRGKNLAKECIRGYINTSDGIVKVDNASESVLFYATQGENYVLSSAVSRAVADRSVLGRVETTNIVNNTPIYNAVSAGGDGTWTATWTGWTLWYKCSSLSTDFENSVQIEKGSSATAFEPFTGTTYTTTYPTAIYRGSEDVTEGEVTSEMPVIDLGDLSWSAYSVDSTGHSFYADVPSGTKSVSSDSDVANLVCENYATVAFRYPNEWINKNGVICQVPNSQRWIIRDERFSDATSFSTEVTGVKLAYELATPTTSPVTISNAPVKSLNGYNHIESSTGDMEIEYITQDYQPLVDLIEKSGGGGSHTYSTTEQVVGKWVDGEDLYERTITWTLPNSSAYTSMPIDLSGVDNVFMDMSASYAIGEHDGYKYSSSWQGYQSSVTEMDAKGFLSVNGSSSNFDYRIGSYLYNGTGYLTLRYTKTTTPTRSLNLTKSAVTEEIPEEIKNAPFEEKPDVNEADDDAPTEVDER